MELAPRLRRRDETAHPGAGLHPPTDAAVVAPRRLPAGSQRSAPDAALALAADSLSVRKSRTGRAAVRYGTSANEAAFEQHRC